MSFGLEKNEVNIEDVPRIKSFLPPVLRGYIDQIIDGTFNPPTKNIETTDQDDNQMVEEIIQVVDEDETEPMPSKHGDFRQSGDSRFSVPKYHTLDPTKHSDTERSYPRRAPISYQPRTLNLASSTHIRSAQASSSRQSIIPRTINTVHTIYLKHLQMLKYLQIRNRFRIP